MKTPRQLLVTQPGMTERGPTVDVLDARGDPILTVARFFGETAEADALLFAGADALLSALEAVSGYLMNAAIDLQTGVRKNVALNKIEDGLKTARAALAQAAPTPTEG